MVIGLKLAPAPYKVEVAGEGQGAANVTAVSGFPKGHLYYEEGLPSGWDDMGPNEDPDYQNDHTKNPTQKYLVNTNFICLSKMMYATPEAATYMVQKLLVCSWVFLERRRNPSILREMASNKRAQS